MGCVVGVLILNSPLFILQKRFHFDHLESVVAKEDDIQLNNEFYL